MNRISLYLFLLLLSVAACGDHEVEPRNYAAVVSLNITGNDESGATFTAQAEGIDKSTIIEHGFVWSRDNNPRLDNAEFVKLGSDLNNETFAARISSRLRQNRKHFVRAFVQSDEYTFLSDTVSFLSLGSEGPELNSFSPTTAHLADTVVLEGSGFSISPEDNVVFFDDHEATIQKSSDDKLWVIVPPGLNSEESTIRVAVSGESSSYDTKFRLIPPLITGLSTNLIDLGETIEIFSGNPLPEGPSLVSVELEYPNGARISISNEDFQLSPLGFKVPLTIESGVFKVVLKYNNLEDVFSQSVQLHPPVINSFSDTEIDYGQELVLIGENFSPFQEKNLVWIDGNEVEVMEFGTDSPLYAGADFIKIKIPSFFEKVYSARQIGVRIEVLGQAYEVDNALEIINPWLRLKNAPFSVVRSSTGTNASGYVIDGASLYSFDFDSKTWVELSPTPREGLMEPVSFIIDNELFLGLGHQFSDLSTRSQDFWKYSISTGSWTQLGDFPGGKRTRSMHFAAQGLGFVGGGSTANSSPVSDFWRYTPANDSWEQIANYPIATDKGFSAVTSNGIFTGSSTNGERKMYRYDIQSDSWSQESEFPISTANSSRISMVGVGDMVYVGGPANGTSLSRYNTVTGEWKSLKVCPAIGKLVFGHNGKVYLNGGFFGTENQTWEYDPAFEQN